MKSTLVKNSWGKDQYGFFKQPPANVDPCGENGEFHTFVYNALFFSSHIPIVTGEIIHKTYTSSENSDWDTGFYFMDVDVVE